MQQTFNLDIAYCKGRKCKLRSNCERYFTPLKKAIERGEIELFGRGINLAAFEDMAGGCRDNRYIPLKEGFRAKTT